MLLEYGGQAVQKQHLLIRARSSEQEKEGTAMRRWGFVITTFYTVLLLALLVPLALRLGGTTWLEAYEAAFTSKPEAGLAVYVALFILGQALLLLTHVDTSWRRIRPRQHIAVSAATVGLFIALLTVAAAWSMWTAIPEQARPLSESIVLSFWWVWAAWAIWATVFYRYYRGSPGRVDSAITWLLRASVLELLIAVPAHVIVRRRDECSAPFTTALGIGTGIAVMLACFGPGVLALYAKRIREHSTRGVSHGAHAT